MKVLMAARSASLYWRCSKKVFELLPKDAAHKGSAVSRLAAHLGRPFCVAVGDDVTDEDMFASLQADGLTVSVGRRSGSKAGYFLAEQVEVLRLLRFIAAAREREGTWE